MEDGVYMAVPLYVHVILCLFLSGRVDTLCLYATY